MHSISLDTFLHIQNMYKNTHINVRKWNLKNYETVLCGNERQKAHIVINVCRQLIPEWYINSIRNCTYICTTYKFYMYMKNGNLFWICIPFSFLKCPPLYTLPAASCLLCNFMRYQSFIYYYYYYSKLIYFIFFRSIICIYEVTLAHSPF